MEYSRPATFNISNSSRLRVDTNTSMRKSNSGWSWIWLVVMCLCCFSAIAYTYNQRKQRAAELRGAIRQLEVENRNLEKRLINRSAELERLKDGRLITAQARRLKLRPPDEHQNVMRFQMVRKENGVTLENTTIGYNR